MVADTDFAIGRLTMNFEAAESNPALIKLSHEYATSASSPRFLFDGSLANWMS
jgi:hypothetical protein